LKYKVVGDWGSIGRRRSSGSDGATILQSVEEIGREHSSGGRKDDNKRGVGDDAITLPSPCLAQK
jgi:hypothetical protein